VANDSAWPAVGYESRPWSVPPGLASRTQQRKHAGPYRAAVVPAIATAAVSIDAGLIAEAAEAAQELVRFDTSVSAQLGAAAELGSMTAILLRTESAASSQIENLTVGARQLALAEIDAHASRNARLVVGNVRAMEAASALSRTIDEATILDMHSALMGSVDERAGRWRTEQVWIGGSNVGPHRADYVAPHHDRVPSAMCDLVEFVARTDIPSLVHIALSHAQFETIHPFTDGNGRTGRALVHAMLAVARIVNRVTVPLSAGLLTETGHYFDALGEYRAGEPSPIVRVFIDAAFSAVERGRVLVQNLNDVRSTYRDRLTARRDSVAWQIVDALIGQPVIDNAYVTERFGVSDVAAQRAIDRLVDVGVLSGSGDRRRNRMWQADEVLQALDEFAAEIKRGL